MRDLGYVESWRELNKRVAADLASGTGDIKPAKVIWSWAHPRTVRLTVPRWMTLKLLQGKRS